MKKEFFSRFFRDRHGFLEDYAKSILPRFHYKISMKRRIRRTKNIREFDLALDFQREAKDFWLENSGRKISLDWHRAYIATNGIVDVRYVPEDLFYGVIVQKLNRFELAKAYQDKNNYDLLFSGFSMPRTVLRNINGRFFDGQYRHLQMDEAEELILENLTNQKLVVKPSIDSGGGRKVIILHPKDAEQGIHDALRSIFASLDGDFIVQDYVEQCTLLHQLHESSLNTLRIMTLRLDGEIHFLSGIVRMGNLGSEVDNATVGGLTCGFNKEGLLNSFATEHYAYRKHRFHPYSGFVFEGSRIPHIDKVIDFVRNLHQRLIYFDLVSWDVAINKFGNPVLIEANLKMQDINFHQRNNGPLFGPFTEEVLCRVFEDHF
jgi:hypothetical protein